MVHFITFRLFQLMNVAEKKVGKSFINPFFLCTVSSFLAGHWGLCRNEVTLQSNQEFFFILNSF